MKTHLALIGYAMGSVRRRAGRTASIMAALVLVTFAFASVIFLTEALRREYRLAAQALPDLTVQRLVAGRPALIEAQHAEALRPIPGVTAVESRVWGYFFVPALAGNFTVVGVDLAQNELKQPVWISMVEGRLPRPEAQDEVVMGESLARFLGLSVGDTTTLPVGTRTVRLQLVGTFRSPVALWTADVILMSREHARDFLGVPAGQATDLAVHLSTPDEAVVVARKIAERIPEARIIDRQLMGRTYDLTFDTRGGVMGAMLLPALIAFLVLAWDRLSGVGPNEWREVGVLKAIGWRTSDVIAARMWEGAIVSGIGAMVGVLAAYAYVFHAHAPGLSAVLLGWSSIYPPFDLVPAVNLGQVVVLISLVVVPFVAAGTVPAWRTAMRDPHELLRGTA